MFKKSSSRRSFLKALFRGVASLFAFGSFPGSLKANILTEGPRIRVPNPFITQDGRPILVCVEGTDYEQMLNTGLQALGGLDLLIDNNQNVLLKPNLVYTEEYPTTSSVSSIVSTIEAIGSVSSGAINVGDTGGIGDIEIYEYFDLEPAVTQAGGNLIVFSDPIDVRRDTWDPEVPDFKVYSDVYNTPIMINLCSLKRHYKSFLTCALKHHVGAMSGPDRIDTRDYIHTFPDESLEFLQVIAEVAGVVNPELTIVDARSIMAINGPLLMYGGEIRVVNKIVICGDMLAAEAYCAQLMQENDETFDISTIQPTLDRAELLGLGTANLNQVEIIEIVMTSVDDIERQITPGRFELYQNYPNPFNPTTNITFALPTKSGIELKLYDITGREVVSIADGVYGKGVHTILFDGSRLANGAYYYRLTAPNFHQSKAMVLMK